MGLQCCFKQAARKGKVTYVVSLVTCGITADEVQTCLSLKRDNRNGFFSPEMRYFTCSKKMMKDVED